VVATPTALESAVHVEVVAVEPYEAHIDFSRELVSTPSCSSRVRLTLLRGQILPAAATVNVYFDKGTGDIDYSTPLNEAPIALWPYWQDKAGFGVARFGTGDFGYDAGAAVGFGKGVFGRGQFGFDADAIRWISPVLPLGRYRFGVKVADHQGNEGPATETTTMMIVPPARPAAGLDIVTYNKQANELTLHIDDRA
jgi:hypothetical protein